LLGCSAISSGELRRWGGGRLCHGNHQRSAAMSCAVAKDRLNYATKAILKLLFACKAHCGEAMQKRVFSTLVGNPLAEDRMERWICELGVCRRSCPTDFDLSFCPLVLTFFYKNTAFIVATVESHKKEAA
jgi:hypothetical protein